MTTFTPNDPFARLISEERRLPPFKLFRATLRIIVQNIGEVANIAAVTLILITIPFYWILYTHLSHNIDKFSLFFATLSVTQGFFIQGAITFLIALPILRITLGKLYFSCCTPTCTCAGRFWFNTCTCKGRLWKMGLFILLTSLIFWSPPQLSEVAKTDPQKHAQTRPSTPPKTLDSHRHVSFSIDTENTVKDPAYKTMISRARSILVMAWIFFAIRLLPLYGAIAAGVSAPVSFAWHLSRGSWWRLLGGIFIAGIIPIWVLMPALFLIIRTLPSLLVPPMLILVLIISGIISMGYFGLAFRFLYETQILQARPSSAPTGKPSPPSKKRIEPTKRRPQKRSEPPKPKP